MLIYCIPIKNGLKNIMFVVLISKQHANVGLFWNPMCVEFPMHFYLWASWSCCLQFVKFSESVIYEFVWWNLWTVAAYSICTASSSLRHTDKRFITVSQHTERFLYISSDLFNDKQALC